MIISSLEELKYIRKEENEIVIGSGTTCHAIEDDESIPYAVRKAASLMGAESLRNLATIGGNICNASPKADLPVPLIMMDAKVTLVSATSSRTLLLDEFITGPKETDLREDELLLEVRIPLPAKPYSHVVVPENRNQKGKCNLKAERIGCTDRQREWCYRRLPECERSIRPESGTECRS